MKLLFQRKDNNAMKVRGIPRLLFSNNRGKASRPGLFLMGVSSIVAIVMMIPILYILVRGLQGGSSIWLKLLDTRIPILIQNTLSLTLSVTVLSVVIGSSLAWLVVRTDLPGRKAWRWILALPLVIPPYIGAITYIIVFGPTGWMRDWFGKAPFPIYSFWGVTLVLVAFTYPYVFLMVSASLKRLNPNLEEAAQALGLNYGQVFRKVVLPILRPAIGAGGILVSLYVLSDFGAVTRLRFTTFTAAIYYHMGSYDQVAAAILSIILIVITLLFILIEAKTRAKQKFYSTRGSMGKPRTIPLNQWKIFMLLYVLAVFIICVVLPITVLIYWAFVGLMQGALNQRFLGYAFNSLLTAGFASITCMFLSLPVVYLKSRYPSKFSSFINNTAYMGYALPGVIVALGVIFIFNQYIPFLYATRVIIITAYIIRFMPQSLQAGDSAISLVSPKLDEAGRSLGYPPWKVMFRVTLPLIMPGVLAGGALVFVSAIKELPATLLLRPAGMDTLAVRTWIDASEGYYQNAAPAALLIILLSIIPLKWMLRKY